jgi:two-component system nitrate/nitrite response regulator NarP
MADLMIVDDHPIFLSGLTEFLQDNGHNVAASARSFGEALGNLPVSGPDIMIVDYKLPDGNGLDLLDHFKAMGRNAPAILLTAHIGAQESRRAMESGVNGMILKESEPGIILRCIESVQLGQRWIDNKIMDSALSRDTLAGDPRREGLLTKSEASVARYVAEGLRNREIAERLNITEGTVKVHVHRILRKLGMQTRTSLACAMIANQ